MLYAAFRALLFQCDAEFAHNITLKALKLAAPLMRTPKSSQPVEVMDLKFPNPIGLAAGFDKNGIAIDGIGKLGFGFVEVGTVTPLSQQGNDKPRIFRVTEAEAVINRLGFNNAGVIALTQQLKKHAFPGILGVNIGKNAATPNHKAIDDYRTCMTAVFPYADYVTINISSPNTKGLRDLQQAATLKAFLQGLHAHRQFLQAETKRQVPLVVKISPDLSATEVQEIAQIILDCHIDGVIATNTTIARDTVVGFKHAAQTGGLSGRPLRQQSTQVVHWLHKVLGDQVPIIAAGGVSSPEDMFEKLEAGAKLVQLYTGMVYQGPKLIRTMLRSLET